MSDIRDFSGKNRKFTGTNGIKLPTGELPVFPLDVSGEAQFRGTNAQEKVIN